MQPAEKRKNLRRQSAYPAFLDLGDGSPARECTLCDASQEGAQLAVADPDSLPDEFILALSSDGAARRRCRVTWRTENQIGVEFLKDRKNSRPRGRRCVRPMRTVAPPDAEASRDAGRPGRYRYARAALTRRPSHCGTAAALTCRASTAAICAIAARYFLARDLNCLLRVLIGAGP